MKTNIKKQRPTFVKNKNSSNKKNSFWGYVFLVFLGLIFCGLTFRGEKNISFYGNSLSVKIGGPFESSNNNARYALTKSFAETGSFFLEPNLANFSAPDITFYNGKYTSIFTPGVSMAAVPLFWLGQKFGLEQVFTYLLNVIFAMVSLISIAYLTKKITGSTVVGMISSLVFLLATNALTYSQTLTQHLMSTSIILVTIIAVLYVKSIWKYVWAGTMLGIGILVDLPNALFLMPALLMLLSETFSTITEKQKVIISLNLKSIALVFFVVPFALFFGYYNLVTNGSPTKVSQFIGRTVHINVEDQISNAGLSTDKKISNDEDTFELPFYTRLTVNGLYILLLSDERGIFYYSPILLFAFVGFILLYQSSTHTRELTLYISTILLITFAYSMFGDPWGGWSFGARYMIPVNALLSILVGVAFYRFVKNPIFISLFFILLIYSLSVNTIGAVTTASVPPRVEALTLPNPVPYTYEYNLLRLYNNLSSSFVYNSTFSGSISLTNYTVALIAFELFAIFSLYSYYALSLRKPKEL